MIEQHSAGGVIIEQGKVLAISWTDRVYIAFPKGGIDEGETSQQAAVREVFEETGYRTKVIAPLGSWTYDFIERGSHYHKTVDYYLMERVDNQPPKPQREPGEDFENLWLELEGARDALSYDDSKGAFDAALALYEKR